LEVDQGTLYPLLRRLEGQGLLESRWALEEARPRRYYRISAEGREGAAPPARGVGQNCSNDSTRSWQEI
jgi:DNA-binding transcriptional ArsR family regulator